MPAPEDMAAWLRGHPYLETEQPEPATVGGVKGVRLDAVVADDVPASECGDACLGLFEVSREIDWVAFEKEKLRFIVLEDVGGERVTIALETRSRLRGVLAQGAGGDRHRAVEGFVGALRGSIRPSA